MKRIVLILSMAFFLIANTTVNQQVILRGLNVPFEYKLIVLSLAGANDISVKDETSLGKGLILVPVVIAIATPIATHIFIKIIDQLWEKWVARGEKDDIVIIIMNKKRFSIKEKDALIEYYRSLEK